jgi:CYTH domain-containing protein
MDEIIEYEKKYLILSPIPFKKDNFPHQKIKQRYIQQDNKPVQRLRSIDNISYKLTQKYNNKRVVGKVEHEIDISYEQFISLKEHCIPAPYGSIRKCRYHIPYGNYMIELDCFEENMDNIIIAEVEFTSIWARGHNSYLQ